MRWDCIFLYRKGIHVLDNGMEKSRQKLKSNGNFNFETIAKYDLKSTFKFLFDNQNLSSTDCLTHSGGGIVLTMLLIDNPNYKSKINSITLFGMQAFGAATNLNNQIKTLAGKYLTALLGKVPSKGAGSTENGETYYTMKQWFDWNLNQNFVGKMNTIRIPILSICAKGDKFIAPKIGCEKFLEAFKNGRNELLFCSKENGYIEDYDHGRILKSPNSKKEIWPIVENWVTNRTIITNGVHRT
jgi:predicted alpha/beta hydrolase